MKKKSIISLALVLALVLGLTACGSKKEEVQEPEPEVTDPDASLMMSQECLDSYLQYATADQLQDMYDEYMAEYVGSEYSAGVEHPAYFSLCMNNGGEPMMLVTTDSNNTRNADKIAFFRWEFDETGGGMSWPVVYNCFMQYITNTRNFSMNMRNDRLQLLRWGSTFYYSEENSADEVTFEIREYVLKPRWTVSSVYSDPAQLIEGTDHATPGLESGEMAEIKWFSVDQLEEAKNYYSQYVKAETHLDIMEQINNQ